MAGRLTWLKQAGSPVTGVVLFALCLLCAPPVAISAVSPAIAEAMLRGRWEEVLAATAGTVASDPQDACSILHYRLTALLQLGRAADAQSLAEKEIRGIPSGKKSGDRRSTDRLAKTDSVQDWVQFDRGQAMLAQTKRHAAGLAMLNTLAQAPAGELAAAALYVVATEESKAKNLDRAALAFNMTREAFPDAVGEGTLVDLFAGDDQEESSVEKPAADGHDDSASRVTNTRYAIQLGVFATKENADALLARVATRRYAGSVEKKNISGKTYFACLVGSFANLSDAQHVRDSLEQVYSASYTVITR